jgi:hypothetical protein
MTGAIPLLLPVGIHGVYGDKFTFVCPLLYVYVELDGSPCGRTVIGCGAAYFRPQKVNTFFTVLFTLNIIRL